MRLVDKIQILQFIQYIIPNTMDLGNVIGYLMRSSLAISHCPILFTLSDGSKQAGEVHNGKTVYMQVERKACHKYSLSFPANL
jgi:hypothetical protein